jgi:aspartyl protease family protein
VPIPTLAQTNLSVLNVQLQQAVSAQNWQRAIQLVDQLMVTSAKRAVELKQYRTELQKLQKAGVKLPLSQASSSVKNNASFSVGQVSIKRRQNGIAVVDVKFNRRQPFEMLVDSGASLTVITRPMALALGLTPAHIVNQAIFSTANGTTVMPIVYVDAIEVGGLVSSRMPVAIAGPDMTIGLLGQDFLQKFDVSFREKVIEFHNRS